eukprot:403332909
MEIICCKFGETESKFTNQPFSVFKLWILINYNIDEITSWSIDHHFPIYISAIKFHHDEKGSDKILIIHIYKNDKVEFLRVRDFANDSSYNILSVCKNYCLIASESQIRVGELIMQFEDFSDILSIDIQQRSGKQQSYHHTSNYQDTDNAKGKDTARNNQILGFSRIISIFYDQTDHFNLIIECTDNSILIEKLIINNGCLSLKNSHSNRLFDISNDSIVDIQFDYEFNTILALKKSGAIEIYKNGVVIYSKRDIKYDDIWVFNKTMYFFSSQNKQVDFVSYVSQEQISDSQCETLSIKDWQSIKQLNIVDIHFTFIFDLIYVVKLNYLRIYDINTHKCVFEYFFDCEMKKVVQLNGYVYFIKNRHIDIMQVMLPNFSIQEMPLIQGEFKQLSSNNSVIYLITKDGSNQKLFRIKDTLARQYREYFDNDDVLVNFNLRRSTSEKLLLFNERQSVLKTLYFQKDEIRKYIQNQIDRKAANFKSDEWFAFENKDKTKLYFQKYDNLIGQMRTFDIEKSTNIVKVVASVPWLNQPVVSGDLIYEVNYIVNQVFSNKIVSSGNRVAVLEKLHKIRIYNQPNQNSYLPKIFESQKYKCLCWKRLDNQIIILDCNQQLITLNIVTGKFIQGYRISKKLLSASAQYIDQIRDEYETSRVVMLDDTFKGEKLKLEKKSGLKLYKLIEIVSNCRIKVVMYFLLPEYKQPFKFSEDLKFMINCQTYEIYQRQDYEYEDEIYMWQQLTFNTIESNNWKYNLNNSIVSPNLQRYIDYEIKNKKYQIKNTLDGKVWKEIPTELTDQSKLNQFIYFRWIGNNEVAMLHDQGVEKIFDIENDFEENNFRIINVQSNYGSNKNIDKGFHINLKLYHLDEVEKKLLTNQNQFLIFQQTQPSKKEIQRLFQVAMIEFQYSWCDHYMKYLPMLEFSFTHYHWVLAEKIISDNTQKILKIHDEFQFLFIKNPEGMTPLHLCLKQRNFFAIDIFLKMLTGHNFYSHSFNIIDILPNIIKTELPSLKNYLDSRVIQTQIMAQYKRGAIRTKKDKNYNIQLSNLWPNRQEFIDNFFELDQLETDVKVMVLDLPRNLEIFEIKTVQYLIDFQWTQTKHYTIIFLYMPYLMNHLIFFIYSNFVSKYDEHNEQFQTKIGFFVTILLLQIYLIITEIRQFQFTKMNYLRSAKNYMDLLQIGFTTCTMISHYIYDTRDEYSQSKILPTIHALASLILWINFLYFLRLFDSTSYLIRIVINVFWDMKWFLILLLVCQIGFAESFLRLCEYSDMENQFVENILDAFVFTFRMSLVDNDTSQFNESMSRSTIWILFVIASVVMQIVMLNLLISIISKSFEDINKQSKLAAYQEKSRIIYENAFIIPASINKKEDSDKFITIIKKFSANQNENNMRWQIAKIRQKCKIR